jgi:subtilase family protein
MQGELRMERRRAPMLARSRRRVAVATAIAALSTLSATAGVAHVNAAGGAAGDVAEWFDEVNSVMVVDQSADCMDGATDVVFYRGDRIVMRPATTMSDGDVKQAVNNALNGIYGGPPKSWATTVERITFPQPPSGPAIKPVLSVSLSPLVGGVPHAVVELARQLRHEPGIESSPDYGLTPSTPYSFFWPDGDPEKLAGALTPSRTNATGVPIGSGIKIMVYDVGIAPRAAGVLPNASPLIAADNEQIDTDNDGVADYPAVGHGLAIGGVIATLAPGAVVQEARVSDREGLATDVSAARRMATSLRNMPKLQWPSLVVNAFGTSACDFDTSTPGLQLEPVGLKAVVEVTDRFDPLLNDGFYIVASAGNQDSSRETYPAAFDSVLAVGALDTTVDTNNDPWSAQARTGPKASFSNHGSWVEAWAPGVDLPTNHVTGVSFEVGSDVLEGKATVDGTSFAAPYVAALLAEHMSLNTNVDARTAWEDIADEGAAPLPECGSPPLTTPPTGVAVALVSLSSSVNGTTPGSGKSVVC